MLERIVSQKAGIRQHTPRMLILIKQHQSPSIEDAYCRRGTHEREIAHRWRWQPEG